jgi:F0F1-type ATP synthase delta subunit
MRAIHYAKALQRQSETSSVDEASERVRALIGVLQRNGHIHLLGKIVRSYEKLTRRRQASRTITIASARPLDETVVTALLRDERFRSLIRPEHSMVERRVDDTLVDGVVVRTKGERVDASAKRALLDLYDRLASCA